MKFKKVFSLIIILFLIAPQVIATVGVGDLFDASSMLGCVDFRILGPCIIWVGTVPVPGIEIQHWRPDLLVETVKKPGDCILPVIGEVVSGMCQGALSALTGALVTSGSTSKSGVSNLQFNEVHVYDYPFKDLLAIFFPLWCIGGPSPPFKYFSEIDFLEWRFGVMETITHPEILLNISCIAPIKTPICMGYWGPIYPRTGAIIHQSEVVGSAGDVVRAVSNTSLFGRNFHHIRISPIWWRPSIYSDKLQMVYPHFCGCMDIGRNPALWESKKTSVSGQYLWLHWHSVTCCLLLEQPTVEPPMEELPETPEPPTKR